MHTYQNVQKRTHKTKENAMYFTIGQAAKETGKAKSTIKKAIDSGELSVSEKNSRGFKIDASELFRVFPKRSKNGKTEQIETLQKTNNIDVLIAKLEAAEKRYEDAQATIDDLRERLTKSDNERTRITTLLTNKQKTKTLLERFLGK